MGGVRDEPLLPLERRLEPVEHLVEGLGEFVEFVARTRSATRAARLSSEAACAAAVILCTGRSARPAAIHPRIAARAMTTASVISEYCRRCERVRSR